MDGEERAVAVMPMVVGLVVVGLVTVERVVVGLVAVMPMGRGGRG